MQFSVHVRCDLAPILQVGLPMANEMPYLHIINSLNWLKLRNTEIVSVNIANRGCANVAGSLVDEEREGLSLYIGVLYYLIFPSNCQVSFFVKLFLCSANFCKLLFRLLSMKALMFLCQYRRLCKC